MPGTQRADRRAGIVILLAPALQPNDVLEVSGVNDPLRGSAWRKGMLGDLFALVPHQQDATLDGTE
jgi:hypothetical protein